MKFTANRQDKMAIADHEAANDMLKRAKAKAKDLARFREQLSEDWGTDINRILGHVIFSPPIVIGVGTEQYTQDIAVIDVDASKIDPRTFSGNVIDLGTKFSREVLADMMNSNRHPSSSSPPPPPPPLGPSLSPTRRTDSNSTFRTTVYLGFRARSRGTKCATQKYIRKPGTGA